MKLFNTLALEINSKCNRKCLFCPNAYNNRPDKKMRSRLVLKALNELGAMGYTGRIEFYIYNEPLMYRPYLEWCVRKARERVPKSCLMIATNGDYCQDKDDLQELFAVGLNQILINCYGKNDHKRWMRQVKKLPSDISRDKSVYAVMSAKSKVIRVEDKSNPNEFGKGVFRLVNRAGNIQDFLPTVDTPICRMCVKPFRFLNINWQGEALVCCQDYHGLMLYGNLANNTLVELWEHPVMNLYRIKLLNKDRTLPLCRACDCHAGAYPHNIPIPTGPVVSAVQVENIFQTNSIKKRPPE